MLISFSRAFLATAFGTSLFALPSFAQLAGEPGFSIEDNLAAPSVFGAHATLSDGRRFDFDGQNFQLFDAMGGFLESLGALAEPTFASFAIVDPSQTFVVVGESGQGNILRVPLDGSGFSVVGNLTFNFDANFDPLDSDVVWISAALNGFGNGNDIVRLDLGTGTTDIVAHVDGPSGPLALDAAGDLFYVTQSNDFPTLPGSLDLVRWSRAQLEGGIQLDENDASLVRDGLDGGSDLAFGPVFGNLFLSEPSAVDPGRVLELDPSTGQMLDTIATTGDSVGKLEFRTVAGIGTFHGFQPSGVELYVRTSNFTVFTSTISQLVPVRPVATLSGPTSGAGAKTLTVEGAEPNSAILVTWGSVTDQLAQETSVDLGWGTPFHSILPLGNIRRQPFFTPTDANGTATWQYFDNGSLHGTLVFQTIVRGANGGFEGSSTFVGN